MGISKAPSNAGGEIRFHPSPRRLAFPYTLTQKACHGAKIEQKNFNTYKGLRSKRKQEEGGKRGKEALGWTCRKNSTRFSKLGACRLELNDSIGDRRMAKKFDNMSRKSNIERGVGSEWEANNLPQVAKSGHSRDTACRAPASAVLSPSWTR